MNGTRAPAAGRSWRSAADHILFEAGGLVLSRFDCLPDDPAWGRVNRTGPWPLIAFPGTSVWIEHEDGPPFVADPTLAVLYAPGTEYGRRILDPFGDHCTVLGMDDRLLVEMDAELRSRTARVDDGVRLRLRRLLWTLGTRDAADPLQVEETLLALLASVVGAPRPSRSAAGPHREIAEEARAVMNRRFHESLTLRDVADAVHVSEYHLARVFRSVTGSSVHGYLTDLRLRAALDRMRPAGGDLARVASEVGFSHHSHLTDQFRRRFGAPPSALRSRVYGATLADRAGS